MKDKSPTPGRSEAKKKEKRIKKRALFIIILMVSGYLAFNFVQLGYNYCVKLDRMESAAKNENKELLSKKQQLTDDIQNIQSLEGRKDQMRKTGNFEPNEVPIIIPETEKEKSNK